MVGALSLSAICSKTMRVSGHTINSTAQNGHFNGVKFLQHPNKVTKVNDNNSKYTIEIANFKHIQNRYE